MQRRVKSANECEFRRRLRRRRLTTLRDLAAFGRCFTGATPGIADPCCRLFDLDGNDAIDLSDYAALGRSSPARSTL